VDDGRVVGKQTNEDTCPVLAVTVRPVVPLIAPEVA